MLRLLPLGQLRAHVFPSFRGRLAALLRLWGGLLRGKRPPEKLVRVVLVALFLVDVGGLRLDEAVRVFLLVLLSFLGVLLARRALGLVRNEIRSVQIKL